MDDIADDALMDCVDKLDARELKGNFSFVLDFLQETVETRVTHVSNEKEIKTRVESRTPIKTTKQNNCFENPPFDFVPPTLRFID